MQLNLDSSRQEALRTLLVGVKVNGGHNFEGKRIIDWEEEIKDIYYNKGIKKFVIIYGNKSYVFRDFLEVIHLNGSIRTKNRILKKVAEVYYKADLRNDPKMFTDFLDDVKDKKFTIADLSITGDEIKWLNRHVTNIVAVFPSSYLKHFKQNFSSDKYTISDKAWNYSFIMYFDSVADIPQSLLEIKNREGNGVDLEKKLMRNTSYIWHLVKDYPTLFNFGPHTF